MNTTTRLASLRQKLASSRLDGLLLLSAENRFYFSGFTGREGTLSETAGALLISAERQVLATDARYETQARNEAESYEIVCYESGLAAILPELVSSLNIAALGVEASHLPYALFRKIQEKMHQAKQAVTLAEADDLLSGIRAIKSPSEVACLKHALELAESSFAVFLKEDLCPGISEQKAAWQLEKRMREAGADGLAFPVIAAFGENSALPHAVSGPRCLQSGDPVLFDWGAWRQGYCSDISRSFSMGKAAATYKKVHAAVYEAQQRAIAAIKPGVEAQAVDAVARSHIEQAGFKGKFGHGLGHGIGLAVHEAPRVSSRSQAVLTEGMVFTVEPGIYLPGWGGVRLENMVVVRPEGAEVLNRLPTAAPERV